MTNPDCGRASRETGSAAVKFLWQEADKANANAQMRACGGDWVPIQSIEVRDGITPREVREDEDAVAHYAEVIDELPPLVVQKDTLVLIGGWNRLAANVKAGRAIVRIAELPCSDDELWERAFEDNAIHGLQMTATERQRAARRYMKAHPNKSDEEIASWSGINRTTVWRWRNAVKVDAMNRPPETSPHEPSTTESSVAMQQNPPTEAARSGVDEAISASQTAPTVPPAPPTLATYGASGTAPDGDLSDEDVEPKPIVMISFGSIVHQSAVDVMDQVPEDKIDLQLREIRIAQQWLGTAEARLEARKAGIPF